MILYPAVSVPKQDGVQTARGDGQGTVRDACYPERRCLALLMSADATGAMLESRPTILGCIGECGLPARRKVSIQR